MVTCFEWKFSEELKSFSSRWQTLNKNNAEILTDSGENVDYSHCISVFQNHIVYYKFRFESHNVLNMKSLFPKGPKSPFHDSSEKIATFFFFFFFRVNISHFINSNNFVVNERCQMKKSETHISFTLRLLYRLLCISLFSTIYGFRLFWKQTEVTSFGTTIFLDLFVFLVSFTVRRMQNWNKNR